MSLELTAISKVYAQRHNHETIEALRDISLSIDEGAFVSIIGPSGCGKTTLLRIISGLEQPTRGTVLLRGSRVDTPDGSIGLIFQEFALFPWRTGLCTFFHLLPGYGYPPLRRRTSYSIFWQW